MFRFAGLPALCLAATLALAGCGPGMVSSNVLRFHTLPDHPEGRSFAVLPDDGQKGSLEFRSYAELVGGRLKALGWRPAASPAEAEVVVQMAYSVDNGRVETWGTPVYSFNEMWRRYYGVQGAYPAPFFEPIGVDTRSTTIFTHRLELRMVEGAAFRGGDRTSLFEGRAVSERGERELFATMPYLVEALLADFPGRNGVPTRVEVPKEPGRR